MYCYIQYIVESTKIEETISEDKTSVVSSNQSAQTLNSTSSSTTTTKLMVNPNCPVQILLDYICSEIGVDKTLNFDLCDIDTVELVGIKQLKPWNYATSVLKSKRTYIIVFYEKDECGQYTKVDPFINKQSRAYSETLLKIMKRLNISKRPNDGRKGKHGSASSRGSTDSLKDPTRRKKK